MPDSKSSTPTMFRFENSRRQKIFAAAAEADTTVSALVAAAMAEWVDSGGIERFLEQAKAPASEN